MNQQDPTRPLSTAAGSPMDTIQHYSLADSGGGRGIMSNGNYSVTFMPLIAVMATIVPRFLSKIKQMRPTQTVSGRDYMSFRDARYYFKEAIDNELCTDIYDTNYKRFANYQQFFYNCEVNDLNKNCIIKEPESGTSMDGYEKYLLGRVKGRSGCVQIQLHLCPSPEYDQPPPCQQPSNHQPPPH